MSRYDNILNILSEEPIWSSDHEQVSQFPDRVIWKRSQTRPKAILEPFHFITSNPGKEIRGKLIEAFNIWLDVPSSKLQVIAKVVNMLHAASLM